MVIINTLCVAQNYLLLVTAAETNDVMMSFRGLAASSYFIKIMTTQTEPFYIGNSILHVPYFDVMIKFVAGCVNLSSRTMSTDDLIVRLFVAYNLHVVEDDKRVIVII